MMKKRALSLILALVLVVGLLPMTAMADTITPDTGWYNDTDTVFVLQDAADLYGLAKLTNRSDGKTFENKTVKLAADIDLDGAEWKPIYLFKGEFDGQGHTISDFYIDATVYAGGFFRTLGTSSYKNTTVHDITFDTVTATVGNTYFGALASYSCDVAVSNVTAKNVTVNATETANGNAMLGGMFGFSGWTNAENCTVENVSIDAAAACYVGGYAGYATCGGTSGVCTCKNYVNCDVNGVKITSIGGKYIGGFIGYANKRWNHPGYDACDVTDIDITVSGNAYVGGFVGCPKAPGTVVNCTTQGKIDATGMTDENAYVGGFYGHGTPEWQEYTDNWHRFSGCVADVDIVSGGATAGGFFGVVGGEDTACHAVQLNDCVATGNVTNLDGIAGGFVGLNNGSPVCAANSGGDLPKEAGTYTNCTASGVVTAKIAGGFIGKVEVSNAEKVYNHKIDLMDCGFDGTVVGTEASGSIVGQLGNLEHTAGHTLTFTQTNSKDEDATVIFLEGAAPTVNDDGSITIPAGSTVNGKEIDEDMTIYPNGKPEDDDNEDNGIGGLIAVLDDVPFVDVSANRYFYDAVKWAYHSGVTGGTDAWHFSPDAGCTRAQIVTFLWRAAGCPSATYLGNFTDVDADAYYATAVAWAVENGITNGTSATTFNPEAVCTRADAVTFLYRAFGRNPNYTASFTDVPANAYFADAVAWAAENGITGGTGNGKFSPSDTCSRAQIVTFLYRTFG